MSLSVLVANRAEIASRVIRTVRLMGGKACAIYSEADRDLPFVHEADAAVLIGGAPPADSYLNIERIIRAARELGVDAVHPGYGFLSEDAAFAAAVVEAGLTWVGPSPESIRALGDKIHARSLAAAAGVPIAPGGSEPVDSVESAVAAAAQLGYPIMVKASAGGGGIGMGVARDDVQLARSFVTAQERAKRFFTSTDILLERYVERSRHIEIQVFGLGDGRVVALGERDCSVQRRHQKVVEETPSPGVDGLLRRSMTDAAITLARAVDYVGAGTVEFLLDTTTGEFFFLEMNTRLQVEHPITELVTGVDLVAAQLQVAAGEPPQKDLLHADNRGHAIEFRIYAEDPVRFFPSPGRITAWEPPSGPGVRVDQGYALGNVVTPHYDPLLAKLCCVADSRTEALSVARRALTSFRVGGIKTNVPFLVELLDDDMFTKGTYDTRVISRMRGR